MSATRLRVGRRIAGSQPRGVLPSVFKVNLLIVFLLFLSSYLRLFHAGENLVQPVVVLHQRFSQHCEPQVHCFNASLCETSRAPRAIHATCNKSWVREPSGVERLPAASSRRAWPKRTGIFRAIVSSIRLKFLIWQSSPPKQAKQRM